MAQIELDFPWLEMWKYFHWIASGWILTIWSDCVTSGEHLLEMQIK